MANWLTDHPAVLDQVWFSDEAHFWLDGQMNFRNAVHWVLTRPLHSQKVTAWMAMERGSGLVWPFFFEDEGGVTQTVNAERYLNTALKSFWKEIKRRDSVDMRRVWM